MNNQAKIHKYKSLKNLVTRLRDEANQNDFVLIYAYNGIGKTQIYTLRKTNDTPYFHHVATLSELKQVKESGRINTYHFNMMRSIMEKTATFFGFDDFGKCIHGIEDDVLYDRALNLLSHGKYSIYEPVEMGDDNKKLFKDILDAFLGKYEFNLPEILLEETTN